MPPIAQRLREPAAFALLAYGALSTLFNTITFLFNPGANNNNGFGSSGPSFSERALSEVGTLLSVVVVAAVVGAVYLAHAPSHLKQAKTLTLAALITLGVADLFGVVALFSSFGASGPTGWDKTSTFFVSLGQIAVAGVGTWLVLGYFQQHQPAAPAAGFQQQQWGPGPQQQQQWQQPPAQQGPPPQQQPWGPPPQQQAPQQTGQQPPQQQQPQPQWGQPQPQHDADSMMTQAIPTVPPAPQGQGQQQQQQQQQQPPQQDGGLGIGNWTSE
ncbi:hypothetical protein Caci_0795 [Catenulispora acidiphila DSM 44928]|uniref:Uncharacterized protein n=1 Tax=Catenulispora acidiphila (strain DSM 44928 / JCM 14897 / NBRC 102108 / NRRL B-24433 / ID139908) TaxID=479433 RepID=C7Q0V2_CATAD|nr:hypothetical protein [Catenulispora acidiphila]ACU69730.1 hypothetical protein Caci_0795 [Catenulispora acidiphila DSM 44928]